MITMIVYHNSRNSRGAEKESKLIKTTDLCIY